MTNGFEAALSRSPEQPAAADPFAADLFQADTAPVLASSVTEVDEAVALPVIEKPRNTNSWAENLPKLSRQVLGSSGSRQRFPEELPEALSKSIAAALSRVVFTEASDTECRLESIAQCDLSAESKRLIGHRNIGFHLLLEPTQSESVITIGSSFVRRVIDRIFGPSVHDSSGRLSPIETTIAEFFAARVIAEINSSLGDEVFSVGGFVSNDAEIFGEHENGAKACLEVQSDGFRTQLHLLCSSEFLSGLENAGVLFTGDSAEKSAADLFRTIPFLKLRAQLGSTTLDAATLSFLEAGDVVIVEQPHLEWNNGSPRGVLTVLAGAGGNFAMSGKLNGASFSVNEISSREAVGDMETARFIMEDKNSERGTGNGSDEAAATEETVQRNETGELSESVANVQIRLRVELAGNKISLRELNSLRIGQVIDLGRGPTDSVNIVTDGSDETVATGELVDIEGRLGVRLTKVYL